MPLPHYCANCHANRTTLPLSDQANRNSRLEDATGLLSNADSEDEFGDNLPVLFQGRQLLDPRVQSAALEGLLRPMEITEGW